MSTAMRSFETGATRNTDAGKLDYEGFLSPLVLKRYAEYMNKHRVQADGSLRDSDNWQKGIPRNVYMKSAWRHFFDWWSCHRNLGTGGQVELEESLCALVFNAMGYLHELQSQKKEAVLDELLATPAPPFGFDRDQAIRDAAESCKAVLPSGIDHAQAVADVRKTIAERAREVWGKAVPSAPIVPAPASLGVCFLAACGEAGIPWLDRGRAQVVQDLIQAGWVELENRNWVWKPGPIRTEKES